MTEIGSGPRVHDVENCPTCYDGCNCPEAIDNLDDQLRTYALALGVIAHHDITDIDADTASSRVWNAYLHVMDLAAQALEAK